MLLPSAIEAAGVKVLTLSGALKERRQQTCTLHWVCWEVIFVRDVEVWESLHETDE